MVPMACALLAVGANSLGGGLCYDAKSVGAVAPFEKASQTKEPYRSKNLLGDMGGWGKLGGVLGG